MVVRWNQDFYDFLLKVFALISKMGLKGIYQGIKVLVIRLSGSRILQS